MPTLQALLDIRTLDLTLHTGDAGQVYTAVRRVDLPAERTWLSAGDLRLTETPFDVTRPDPDPLFASNPCAVGYALTPKQRRLPKTLLEHVRERGVALFTVPPQVNMARVRDAALRLMAEEPQGGFQAAAELQRYLLESLDSPKPERELLERLHVLTGKSFVLLSPWGSPLARSGPSGWKGPGSNLNTVPEGHYRFQGKPGLVLRVEDAERLGAVLFALDTERGWLPLLELARGVLRLAARERRAEADRESILRSALLAEWLSGAGDLTELLPRLKAAGLEPDSSFVVAVCEPGERSRPNRQQRQVALLKRAGDAFFRTAGLPALAEERSDHCLWAFNAAEPETQLTSLVAALRSATDETFRLGISLPQRDYQRAAAAHRQALLAAQTVNEPQGGRSFSNLDPVTWVLEQQPLANLRALHDRLVGPIKAADDSGKLWRTLLAYLRTPGDMSGLASRLHIHVNTLRYRLSRIEELIGRPLSQPEMLAQLYLATQIDGMMEKKL